MNYLSRLSILLAAISLVSCQPKQEKQAPEEERPLVSYVDPHIGSGGHGHVFVGANVPFGMVQLGPTSIPETWDFCSGYHISDSTVIGFSHTHLSGTGIGDLFDVTVMPVVGEVTYARGTEDNPNSGLWSYQDRSREVAEPGYYSTYLTRYGVKAELTASQRVGYHRYTFDKPGAVGFVFDLENGGCWDDPTEAFIHQVDEKTLEGYRYSTGWAKDQRVYFTATFDHPIDSVRYVVDNKRVDREGKGKVVYAHVYMTLADTTPVHLNVALSPTSIENAKLNSQADGEPYTFDQARQSATDSWESALDKVRIETPDSVTKRIFYTGLYHTMVAPSLFSDANGEYYGSDHQNHTADGFTNYTTLSLWDTYRAAHPLMSIIHPEMVPDIVATFMHIFREQGKLPVWHLMGCETNTMVGNPGICVLADAVLKGFASDPEAAFQAMKSSAMLDERGMKERKKYGYLPKDVMQESVAYDLEYALADHAVALVAQKLGHQEDYEYFLHRSKSYQHLFDPESGFMRGKDSKGNFGSLSEFDPYASNHRDDDYCEGNAWQYTFLVPHDVKGLVDCFGSEEAFTTKLDSLFTVSSVITGDGSSPDISGLIGQYAHGNEPGHHTIYMYSVLGHRDKAAPLLREVMTTLYSDQVDGLSGNEDVGEMSAWYILSALGLYQVEPAGGRYYFGSPIVDSAKLKVSGGTFEIIAHDNSTENIYITEVKLNGEPYDKPYIDYQDIVKGGTLEFQMASQPLNK